MTSQIHHIALVFRVRSLLETRLTILNLVAAILILKQGSWRWRQQKYNIFFQQRTESAAEKCQNKLYSQWYFLRKKNKRKALYKQVTR